MEGCSDWCCMLGRLCASLLQFLSRPFVAGDSITVQGVGNMVFSGTVERVTLMRTLMRTDDDVLVTVPNKVGDWQWAVSIPPSVPLISLQRSQSPLIYLLCTCFVQHLLFCLFCYRLCLCSSLPGRYVFVCYTCHCCDTTFLRHFVGRAGVLL